MTAGAPPAHHSPSASDRRAAQALAAEGHGLLALLRALERARPDRPRIGRNRRLRDAVVRLGQDPFLSFPDNDLSRVDLQAARPQVRANFLGFYGAFGALPLNWTEEIFRWFEQGDEAFVAFGDIFVERFQALFFRAWSDARRVTQFDHPDDRFQTWLLAALGLGSPAWRQRGTLPDATRLGPMALSLGRVKSPVRLNQILARQFPRALRVEIIEMVPSWLDFEADSLSRLGQQGMALGRDLHLGSRVRSVNEKIRLHLRLPDRRAYGRMLPGGPDHALLADLVFGYLGLRFDIEVELSLPEAMILPAQLGGSPGGEPTALGWMACLAPGRGADTAADTTADSPPRWLRVASYRLTPQPAPAPAAPAPAPKIAAPRENQRA